MEKQKMCFKRWSRKSYGIFASLGSEIKIGVVGLSCSILLLGANNAAAQSVSDTTQTIRLSDIEITAERQQLYSDLARIVTVVSKEEIKNAPVQSIADLLRYVSGVDIRQRGANGVQTDISVRGGTFDQVLVLINGVPVSDPHTGHHTMNLPLDLAVIDRVEILQGPGSRLLGPNAFSGAINIVTGTAKESSVGASLVGGDNSYVMAGVNATVVADKVTGLGSISKTSSDGYAEDTDFDFTNIFGQVRVDSKSLGDVNFQAGSQVKQFGAYGFYSLNPKYANEYEKTRAYFASLSSEKKIGRLTLSPKVFWRQHHDRFELFRDGIGAYTGYQHNYHQTDVYGADLNASYISKLGKTSVGGEYKNEHIYSNALGKLMDSPIQVPFAENGVEFTKEKSRENYNYFIDHAIYLNKFSVSAGALGNYCDDFGSNYYFGADMGYRFSSAFNVYVTANQSLRLPTFTDLYLKTSAQQGNVDLKPEKAMTYELGMKYRKKGFSSSLSAYFRNGKDVIDWVKFSDSDVKYLAVNHAEINAMGADAFVQYVTNSIVKRIRVSYSFLNLDKNSVEFDSKYALDYLKNKVSVDLDHSIYKGLGASWRFTYLDRAGDYKDALNVTVPYSEIFLTDLRLSYKLKKLTLFGEASNLFDVTYNDYGGIIQPSRWVKAGIVVKL